jgi:uncharacterized protein
MAMSEVMKRRSVLRALSVLSGTVATAWASRSRADSVREADALKANAFELTQNTLFLDDLHELHQGLRIAQLSDIHVGRDTPDARIIAAIDAINVAQPDIVILTGDYVTRKGDPLERVPELLKRLQPPTFAVLGNHDHWTDAQTIGRDLGSIGCVLLQNQNTVVQVRGAPLTIIGIDDAVSHHDDAVKSLRGTQRASSRIVLAHAPPTLDSLPEDEGLVVFSGHTHGGQMYIEGVTERVFKATGQPYVRGKHARGKNQLYVNRGLGFGAGTRLPRHNSDPEVALIELRRRA